MAVKLKSDNDYQGVTAYFANPELEAMGIQRLVHYLNPDKTIRRTSMVFNKKGLSKGQPVLII